jgi:hypothetical protein
MQGAPMIKVQFIGVQESPVQGYEYIPLFNVIDPKHPLFGHTLTIPTISKLFKFKHIQWEEV